MLQQNTVNVSFIFIILCLEQANKFIVFNNYLMLIIIYFKTQRVRYNHLFPFQNI